MNGRIYIIVYMKINMISVVEFQKQDFWQKLKESLWKVGDDFRKYRVSEIDGMYQKNISTKTVLLNDYLPTII